MVQVTKEQVETYKKDGAVCLRNVFDATWVNLVRQGIAAAIETPGPNGENYNPDGSAFYGDLDMWQRHDEFKQFVLESPAAKIVAQLMQSERINFFYDQMLVKEPGATTPTPWHQDQPYWSISGRQVCSIWLPLDPVDKKASLAFVAGSHHWGLEFNPRHFSDNTPYEGTGLADMPDIDANPEKYSILSWAVEPGDCIVFQAAMVHGAKGNDSSSRRRRILATRWAGDDARFCVRPGETAIPTFETGLAQGDKFSGPLFPEVYPGGARKIEF